MRHRLPNNTRVTAVTTKRYVVGNGTPYAYSTDCLRYRVGSCPGASVANPHTAGDSPDTCDWCYIVRADSPVLPLPTRRDPGHAVDVPAREPRSREWYRQRQQRDGRTITVSDRDYFRPGIARAGFDPDGDCTTD